MDRRFRRLATGTTALTFVLVLLGVYTAASGSGLACAQRWPLCDGAVFGLFPATWPSFVEWFHRLVAMVTGLAILATAGVAWRRGGPRSVRVAAGVAVAFLPAQVLLGAETVWTYTTLSRVAHFLTALVILGSLAVATVRARPNPRRRRPRASLAVAAGLAVCSLVLGPGGPLVYTPLVQVGSTAAGLGAFVLLLGVGSGPGHTRLGQAAGVAATLVALTLLARRLVYTDPVPVLDLVGTVFAVAVALGSSALIRRSDPARPRSTGSD